MECPTCRTELQPTTYEDVSVMQCGDCNGYFVAKKNLRLIKATREHSSDQLSRESERERGDDTAESVRCPKCRVERMEKKPIRVGDEGRFFLDECNECHGVWLDGGELARLQIKYEASAVAIDAFARQEQMQSRTGEQKAEFEDRLEKLPTAPTAFRLAGIDLAIFAIVIVTLLAAIISWSVGRNGLAALFSIPPAVIAAYFAFARLDEYLDVNRYMRYIAVGFVVAIEIIVLVFLFTSR